MQNVDDLPRLGNQRPRLVLLALQFADRFAAFDDQHSVLPSRYMRRHLRPR